MNLSVVTGTFNRLQFLQRMIESVRRPLRNVYGFTYQVVVVDGGSVDGTQDWCRAQPDVKLIEHGQLLGAIRAFNDGAEAAEGDFVILANDDIEFVGDSVLQAWVLMQDNPSWGMGCFYQDRNGKNWHVEHMYCVRENWQELPKKQEARQMLLPYGQVAIVPRELGNTLGWWGNDKHTYGVGWWGGPSHTYGGDNHLTANVYESGYKVVPLYLKPGIPPTTLQDEKDGCRIHDFAPDDALRKQNNIRGAQDPRAVGGAHPDSAKFGRTWTQQRWGNAGLSGPMVRSSPQFSVGHNRHRRILYLPIFEIGYAVQKEQKRGLREALARVGVVWEYDYVGRNAEIGMNAMVSELREVLTTFRPDLVLTQFHGPDPIGPDQVRILRQAAPGATFVNWNGDFWPQNLLSEGGISLARAFDWQLVVNREALEKYLEMGINAAYWQIGWEPDGEGCEVGPRHDVVFLANGYSPERQEFVKRLRNLRGIGFGLYGRGWPNGWAAGDCLYDFKQGCSIYRGAKFGLGDSQWPESGFVSNRVFQALVPGGAALCHQWFRGMEELGLVDGQTCIVWTSFEDLVNRLNYYLTHEGQRSQIAENGRRLALNRHSFDVRVRELLDLIEQREQPEEETGGFMDWR